MHTTTTSTAVAAGKWSATAKTVALGAAGTALWGSLAFYFVAGYSGTGADVAAMATDEPATRIQFRTELAETELLRGCELNNGAGACDGMAWARLTHYISRPETTEMPSVLKASLPQPLWDDLATRNEVANGACTTALTTELPTWLASVPRVPGAMSLTLVPGQFASCDAMAASFDPSRDRRSFWFIDGDRVVAEMRCSVPGSFLEPACELAAYPEEGRYEVSFAQLPAGNIERIIEQAPHMMEILNVSLPEEMAGIVNLDVVHGPFAVDAQTSAVLADLDSTLN